MGGCKDTRDWEPVSRGSAEVRRAGVGRGGAQTGLTAPPFDSVTPYSFAVAHFFCFVLMKLTVSIFAVC